MMLLRKLTDEETVKIKKSKDGANKIIREQRKKLVREISGYRDYSPNNSVDLKLRALKQRLEKTQLVIGHPVIVNIEGMSVLVDYDRLNKFGNSLGRSGFWNHTTKIEGASLILRYRKHDQSGAVELFIPDYQAELLKGLPSIDLTA